MGGSSLHFYFRDFSLGSGLSGVDSYVHIVAVTHHGGQRLRATFSVAFVVYYGAAVVYNITSGECNDIRTFSWSNRSICRGMKLGSERVSNPPVSLPTQMPSIEAYRHRQRCPC